MNIKLIKFGIAMILISGLMFLALAAIGQEQELIDPHNKEEFEKKMEEGMKQLQRDGNIEMLNKFEDIFFLINNSSYAASSPMQYMDQVIVMTPWSAELPDGFPFTKEFLINTLLGFLNKSINDPNQLPYVKMFHETMAYNLNILLASAPTK